MSSRSRSPSTTPPGTGSSYLLLDLGDPTITGQERASVAVVVGVVVGLVALYLLTETCLLPWWRARRTSPEALRQHNLELAAYSEQCSRNFYTIWEGYSPRALVAEEGSALWRARAAAGGGTGTSMVGTQWGLPPQSRALATIPFLLLLLFLLAIVLVADAIARKPLGTTTTPTTISATATTWPQSGQLQAGLVLFFIAVNGFYMNRMLRFYKQTVEVKKKIAAHGNVKSGLGRRGRRPGRPMSHQVLPGDGPATALQRTSANPEAGVGGTGELGSSLGEADWMVIAAPLPSAQQRASVDVVVDRERDAMRFDEGFNYRRRIKHLEPQYYQVHWSFMNATQLFLLVAEFLQLAYFPLRDLMRNSTFQAVLYNPKSSNAARQILADLRGFLSLMAGGLPNVETLFLARVQFAMAWWCSLLAVCVALLLSAAYYLAVHADFFVSRPLLRRRIMDFATDRWILAMLPLVNLFYLVVLTSLIDPLGCLSDSTTPPWPVDPAVLPPMEASKRQQRRCSPITQSNPSLNTFLALGGYLMAYTLLTIAKTAPEPLPKPGVISFTSRSEVVHKSGALLILLLYTLIPTQASTTVRGILAALVLVVLIAYNLILGSSYIRWINALKLISYTCLLWITIVVVYITHPASAEVLSATGMSIFLVLFLGCVVLVGAWVAAFSFVVEPSYPFARQAAEEAVAAAARGAGSGVGEGRARSTSPRKQPSSAVLVNMPGVVVEDAPEDADITDARSPRSTRAHPAPSSTGRRARGHEKALPDAPSTDSTDFVASVLPMHSASRASGVPLLAAPPPRAERRGAVGASGKVEDARPPRAPRMPSPGTRSAGKPMTDGSTVIRSSRSPTTDPAVAGAVSAASLAPPPSSEVGRRRSSGTFGLARAPAPRGPRKRSTDTNTAPTTTSTSTRNGGA